MKHFVLTIAVLLATSAANAEIYQWKDASGKTIISDKPPTGTTQPQKTFASDAPASNGSAQKTAADKDLEFRKRQKESQESSENCDNARRYLKTLESGERISQTDDKGERYYMEDSQRAQEISKSRQNIQANCK